MQKESV